MKKLLALILAAFSTPAHAWEVSFDPPVVFATTSKPFSVGISILAEPGDESFPGYGLLGYDWAVEGPYTVNAPLPLAICRPYPGSVEYCWDIVSNLFYNMFRIGNRLRIDNFLTFTPNSNTASLPPGSYSFHIAYGGSDIIYLDLEIVESLRPKPCNTKKHRVDHYHKGPGFKGIVPTPFIEHRHKRHCEEPIL